MGKGHIWLLVTSESALSMFLSCFNPLANLSRVGQQGGKLPKISSSHRSFALPKTSEVLQRKRMRVCPWWSGVSAYADSPHLESTPIHDSTANHASVVLLSRELTTLPELLWVISLQKAMVKDKWLSLCCARSNNMSFKMQMSRTTPLFNCRGSSSVDFSYEPSAREKHCPVKCCRAG